MNKRVVVELGFQYYRALETSFMCILIYIAHNQDINLLKDAYTTKYHRILHMPALQILYSSVISGRSEKSEDIYNKHGPT